MFVTTIDRKFTYANGAAFILTGISEYGAFGCRKLIDSLNHIHSSKFKPVFFAPKNYYKIGNA